MQLSNRQGCIPLACVLPASHLPHPIACWDTPPCLPHCMLGYTPAAYPLHARIHTTQLPAPLHAGIHTTHLCLPNCMLDYTAPPLPAPFHARMHTNPLCLSIACWDTHHPLPAPLHTGITPPPPNASQGYEECVKTLPSLNFAFVGGNEPFTQGHSLLGPKGAMLAIWVKWGYVTARVVAKTLRSGYCRRVRL